MSPFRPATTLWRLPSVRRFVDELRLVKPTLPPTGDGHANYTEAESYCDSLGLSLPAASQVKFVRKYIHKGTWATGVETGGQCPWLKSDVNHVGCNGHGADVIVSWKGGDGTGTDLW